jgi:hypothetical protein
MLVVNELSQMATGRLVTMLIHIERFCDDTNPATILYHSWLNATIGRTKSDSLRASLNHSGSVIVLANKFVNSVRL